jgi:hypothetical protein
MVNKIAQQNKVSILDNEHLTSGVLPCILGIEMSKLDTKRRHGPHDTIWNLLRRYPPCACRLFARTRGRKPRVLTTEEVAERAGLAVPVVLALSEMDNWQDVTIGQMRAFAGACGLDFGNRTVMKQQNYYLSLKTNGKWSYLRRSPDWETYYLPLLMKWKECYAKP